MLTGPLLGTVLDRWQLRLVMGIDNCTRALLIGAIPVLYDLHSLQPLRVDTQRLYRALIHRSG